MFSGLRLEGCFGLLFDHYMRGAYSIADFICDPIYKFCKEIGINSLIGSLVNSAVNAVFLVARMLLIY